MSYAGIATGNQPEKPVITTEENGFFFFFAVYVQISSQVDLHHEPSIV